MTRRELMESFRDAEPARVERNGQAYVETEQRVKSELQRHLNDYRALDQVCQTGRLIRDDMDNQIRRYHDYVIAGQIVAHYRQKGCRGKQGNVFEHVIPARTLRNMYIADRITVDQVLNAPTCIISPDKNDMLRKLGLAKTTPNAWFFWQRYKDLGIEVETYDGTLVDFDTWDFDKHCEYFGIDL